MVLTDSVFLPASAMLDDHQFEGWAMRARRHRENALQSGWVHEHCVRQDDSQLVELISCVRQDDIVVRYERRTAEQGDGFRTSNRRILIDKEAPASEIGCMRKALKTHGPLQDQERISSTGISDATAERQRQQAPARILKIAKLREAWRDAAWQMQCGSPIKMAIAR